MNNLKEVRTRQSMVLQHLAVAAKVSTATLNGIEKYDMQPIFETRQRIAAALKVSVAEIWPETDGA